MEDNKNSGAESGKDENTEQEGVDSTNNDGDNDGEGADGADDKGENDDGSGDGDDDGGKSGDDKSKDKSDKKDEKTNPDEDEEPKTRKRNNIDFILERKDRKIQKLKDKDNKGSGDDTDDGDINPEDEKVIGKVVSKYLNPIIEKQIKEEDEQEIATFLGNNPEFKPYADKVRKFASHESRKSIPIESIFYEVAGKDLMKIGAEKAKKADKDAKDSGAGGGNNRGGSDGGTKSVWDMTPEEFEKEQQKVRSNPRE